MQVHYSRHNEQGMDVRYSYNTGTELTSWNRHTDH